MERVEKVLLLAVLGVALMIVAVMSFLPEDVKADPRKGSGASSDLATGSGQPPSVAGDRAAGDGAGHDGAGHDGAARGGAARDGASGPVEDLQSLMGANAPRPKGDGTAPDGGGIGPRVLDPGPQKTDGGGGASDPLGMGGPNRGEEPGPPVADPGAGASPPPEGPAARVAMQYAQNPDYLQYIVLPGDTLGQILEDICGSVDALDDVLRCNEDLKDHPNRISPGYPLLIPKFAIRPASERTPKEPKVVEAPAGGKAAGAEAPPAKAVEVKPPRKAATKERGSAGPERAKATLRAGAYVVKPGDNLWKIAVRRVGAQRAAGYVTKLQEVNANARGTIVPGMTLRLP